MERAEKQEEIESLSGVFGNAQGVLCGDYRGLTVAQVTTLRKELHKVGATGKVVKNTLAYISAERTFKGKAQDAEVEKFLKLFNGPSFVVYSNADPVAPAKVLAKFGKDNVKFKIKGGFLEGAFMDSAGVESLSKLPGKAETLSKLLALISAPATQLARLLNEPGSQLVRTLEAHRANLEKKGQA